MEDAEFIAKPDENILIRIVFWERRAYADSFARHLTLSRRPFVVRDPEALPPPTGAEGSVPFELFVLPVSTLQLLGLLNPTASRGAVGRFSLDDVPMIGVSRLGPPRDPNEPHREFQHFLKILPQWIVSEDIDRDAFA